MVKFLLHDDGKSKKELLENAEVQKTSYKDASEILDILKKAFNIPSRKAVLMQLLYSDVDLDNSVKIVDKRDNKIYGLLIFCNYTMQQGSPITMSKYAPIAYYLNKFKQLNGHSFVIDSRLRGTGLDKDMLHFNQEFIEKYDFIWCGVEKELNSHNYWKRMGFTELFSIPQASFYIRNTKQNSLLDIFILKTLCEKQWRKYE